ncbi:hypothetical protein [Thiococcus pfennigii]|uniref:hypothetical protein n=1 Tax=Thiococcus pfennigii TaxID=1057 RepID=UPI001F5B09E9|nr:hypothetical protein [Thiococcus pfennigii]
MTGAITPEASQRPETAATTVISATLTLSSTRKSRSRRWRALTSKRTTKRWSSTRRTAARYGVPSRTSSWRPGGSAATAGGTGIVPPLGATKKARMVAVRSGNDWGLRARRAM